MRARFRRHLETSGLLDGSRTVLVALSGGLDSVALLHLLRFGDLPLTVRAAHFDHRMRPDSAADARWVGGLCRAWSVPCTVGRAAAPLRGEARARDARYDFLLRTAGEVGADAVATAHHADDQAETVLFRLARGTGLTGLAGIRPRRGAIVRPLLPFTRAELVAYAQAARLRWREDPTNAQLGYARNRIRHTVLPALEAVTPGATRRIARLAERAAEAETAWQAVVAEAVQGAVVARSAGLVELARDRLLGYHPHVRARVMRHLLRGFGSVPDRAGTAALLDFLSTAGSGAAMMAAGGVRIAREFDVIRVYLPGGSLLSPEGLLIRGPEPGHGRLDVGGRALQVRWGAAADPDDGDTAAFDPAALRFPLSLRAWQPGDRVRLPYGSKKLKKLFQERRVGRAARARVPVLVDAAGSVLWVVGVARSVLAPPLEQRVFTITVMDGQSQ